MLGLELKNIKHSQLASQETHCYAANLYLRGKLIALVSNEGYGGCDCQNVIDTGGFTEANEFFKALPPLEVYGMKLPQSLEGWCGDQVNNFLEVREFKRLLKSKNTLLILRGAKILSVKYKSPNPLEKATLAIYHKTGKSFKQGDVILNELGIDEAFKIYKQENAQV